MDIMKVFNFISAHTLVSIVRSIWSKNENFLMAQNASENLVSKSLKYKDKCLNVSENYLQPIR